MTAYYNEIDPFAAQWLRELIKTGMIAPGDVDERSIEDVRPDDIVGYTQCHFFAGIGVWSHSLRRAGWPDDRPIWTGSCPCQPFSSAGKGDGFDDERHLWPAFQWLIQQCAPANIIGEQVASKAAGQWIDLVQADLEAMGYAFGCVPFPSAGVGAPHLRDRAYWVAHSDGARPSEFCGDRLESSRPAKGGSIIGLAHRTGLRRDQGRTGFAATECDGSAGDGTDLGVGHSDRLGTRRDGGAVRGALDCENGQHDPDDARTSGAGVGLVDTEHAGHCRSAADASEPCGHEPQVGLSDRRDSAPEGQPSAGPVNGFWRDADWLFCRDGKWRPVEPGTFPLAHGAAARVGRLRGYGNAINAEAAQAWIETVMEVIA